MVIPQVAGAIHEDGGRQLEFPNAVSQKEALEPIKIPSEPCPIMREDEKVADIQTPSSRLMHSMFHPSRYPIIWVWKEIPLQNAINQRKYIKTSKLTKIMKCVKAGDGFFEKVFLDEISE